MMQVRAVDILKKIHATNIKHKNMCLIDSTVYNIVVVKNKIYIEDRKLYF